MPRLRDPLGVRNLSKPQRAMLAEVYATGSRHYRGEHKALCAGKLADRGFAEAEYDFGYSYLRSVTVTLTPKGRMAAQRLSFWRAESSSS